MFVNVDEPLIVTEPVIVKLFAVFLFGVVPSQIEEPPPPPPLGQVVLLTPPKVIPL